MKRPDNLIICDNCLRGTNDGEVIDDGVTILNGYIEADCNNVIQYISEDPNNKIEQSGVLKFRHKDESGNLLVKKLIISEGNKYKFNKGEKYHFHNINCLNEWNEKNKNVKETNPDNTH